MRIELLQEHEHAGTRHPPGTTLELLEAQARWLIEAGVARPARAPATRSLPRNEDPLP